ncbi:hypothetical protein LIER_38636 [Lithospermum erythrorhizon]|uniref:Plant bHLH transcription factor ACT-like domain-containing protein n=1 Tax=Lithospermum erythrorhizon TaxID=34254 RepID=A0AAV3Q4U5_LITER
MTKANIVNDAITYIEELQNQVSELTNQLQEMEVTEEEGEMKLRGIEPEVEVARIDETKLWIKMVCPKKEGAFTKLMEAITALGFEPNNASGITSRGALLVTLHVEEIFRRPTDVRKIQESLLETITSI